MAVAVEERQLVAPVTAVCFTEDCNWVLSGCGPYLRVHPTRADQGQTGQPFYQTKVCAMPVPTARARARFHHERCPRPATIYDDRTQVQRGLALRRLCVRRHRQTSCQCAHHRLTPPRPPTRPNPTPFHVQIFDDTSRIHGIRLVPVGAAGFAGLPLRSSNADGTAALYLCFGNRRAGLVELWSPTQSLVAGSATPAPEIAVSAFAC